MDYTDYSDEDGDYRENHPYIGGGHNGDDLESSYRAFPTQIPLGVPIGSIYMLGKPPDASLSARLLTRHRMNSTAAFAAILSLLALVLMRRKLGQWRTRVTKDPYICNRTAVVI